MTVGLALSGGGAMGAAHIGILEEVERSVGLDVVCGSSAGAISGLVYVDGGSEAVERFVDMLDKAGLLGRTVGFLARSPSVTFETLRQVLRAAVKARSFDELKCKFTCIATDIVSGAAVVLDEGDPVAAAMASSAFPGVFKAQQVNGRVVVDGGVTKNLPADVVRSQGADFVVGSSLYHCAGSAEGSRASAYPGRLQAVLRAFDIMSREMAVMQSRECDYCFCPPVETFRWYDFDHVREIMELGRVYARREIDNLEAAVRGAGVHSL